MLPLLVLIAFHARGSRIRWWLPIPLFLIWLLLLPLVLVLLPFAIAAMLIAGMKPLRDLRTFWQLLSSLPGTRIDMDDGRQRLYLRVI